MGCDLRILQMDGAKDPDEYIIKYGNVRFLNEIAKLISKVNNTMEREIYIEKIAKEYQISKEAIYAEVNKLLYAGAQGQKVLYKKKSVIHRKETSPEVSANIKKRENMILAILLTGDLNLYEIIKQNVKAEEFKDVLNQQIAKKLYEEFEKGNSNINGILDNLSEEEQSHITAIMADDYEIKDMEKAIDDVIHGYQREKLNSRKMQILTLLDQEISATEKKELEKELNEIIIQLAKMK